MGWSTPSSTASVRTPSTDSYASDVVLEKAYSQQWQPARRRLLSDPLVFQKQSRRSSMFRGKRGIASFTTLLLLTIVLITTLTLRPHYGQTAIEKIQNLGQWKHVNKWKAAQAELMGHWTQWEESLKVSTSNPTTVSASDSAGMREPHRGLANPEIIAAAVQHAKDEAKPKEPTKYTESTLDRSEAMGGIGGGLNMHEVPESVKQEAEKATAKTIDESSPATGGIASNLDG